MAVQAIAHFELVRLGHQRHLFHLAVALLAADPRPQVPLVAEIDMVREAVDPGPLHSLAGVEHLVQLLHVRLIQRHYGMAAHANIHRRDTGVRAFLGRAVAVKAIHFVVAGVDFVAERDRLVRGVPGIAVQVPEVAAGQGGQDQYDQDKMQFALQ